MYKNILFDVDGTLLPMDVHEFVKYYFGSLCEKMIPVLKIEPKALTDSIMAGLGAMAKNDGSALNRDVFWKAAAKVSGVDLIKYEDMFTDYYNNEFVAAKTATFVNPYAKKCVATVYKGNIIKNLIMDCQSYTKYRPNETTGGIFVSWRRKEELPTGA